jgi:hypothetical protein
VHVIEYIKALQPRRVIWFAVFAIGGISFSGAIGYIVARVIGSNPTAFRWSAVISGGLLAVLIILFFSGFNAWDKERRKNADKWPRLSAAQRVAIADALRPFAAEPEISIFSNGIDDAANLAIDLCDTFGRATNDAVAFTPPSNIGFR